MKALRTIVLSFILATSGPGFAASMDNAEVVKMLKAGLPEAVILQAIQASDSPAFDTTAGGLIALKESGATPAVLQAVLSRQSASGQAPKVAAAGASTLDCKIEAPDPGFQIMRASGSLQRMTYQTPSADRAAGGRLGNVFSFGISKVKVTTFLRIEKDKAALRIRDSRPEFLDLFAPIGAAPGDFMAVIKFLSKDNARFIPIGSSSANTFGSKDSGFRLPDEVRVPVTNDLVSDRCQFDGKVWAHYRIRPTSPMEPGEYALLAGAKFYDFGIDKE